MILPIGLLQLMGTGGLAPTNHLVQLFNHFLKMFST